MTPPSDDEGLTEGLYDALVTSDVERRLRKSLLESKTIDVDDALLPITLSRHVQERLFKHLRGLKKDAQIDTANDLMRSIGALGDMITSHPQRLVSLRPTAGPGVRQRYGDEPVLPLSDVALLTNTGKEPNFGHEIRGELASADDVQLICAFIKWHGVRTLQTQLAQLAERGDDSASSPPPI